MEIPGFNKKLAKAYASLDEIGLDKFSILNLVRVFLQSGGYDMQLSRNVERTDQRICKKGKKRSTNKF